MTLPPARARRAAAMRVRAGAKVVAALASLPLVAACVAPEEPEQHAVVRPSTVQGASQGAHLEDAPVPNRALRDNSSGIIRIQQ